MYCCPDSGLDDPLQVWRVYRQRVGYNVGLSRFNTTHFYPNFKLLDKLQQEMWHLSIEILLEEKATKLFVWSK